MAVAHEELQNSPRIRGDENGLTAVRELKCAWDDAIPLAREYMGTRTPFGPALVASFPGFPFCLATSFSIDPLFADLTPEQISVNTSIVNTYGTKPAKVTINFTTKPYTAEEPREEMPTTEPGTFLSYRMRFGVSMLTLKGRTFVWEDNLSGTDPVPEDVVMTKRIPLVEHSLTWHKVTRPPWKAIRQLTGTINTSTFVGAEADTLLFDGAEADREYEIDPDQESTWRLSYTFLERRIVNALNVNGVDVEEVYGWNHQYRPHDGEWKRPRRRLSPARYTYATSDFSELFRYAT